MFIDMGKTDPVGLARAARDYRPWLRARLKSGKVVGLLAVDRTGLPRAGGCLWFRENPPRPDRPGLELAYIMSIYTAPAWRRRGVGRAITLALVEIARSRGHQLVSLHASDSGRELYATLGFEEGREMRLVLPPHGKPRSRPRR